MARIAVINPPHRRHHRKHRNPKRVIRKLRHRRHLSAAQRAVALANLVKARAARKAKENPKRRHHHRKHRHHRRKKRSETFINPFQGTLMTLGNPKRKRRHTHMARKKHHRRHHRRALSNPLSANALLAGPKEMIQPSFLMEAAGVAAGFVLPNMAMNYLPVTWRSATWSYYASKIGTIAILSAAGNMVSKRVSKFVLVGGAVSLMLDLYTEFIKGVSPVPATATAPATTTAPATSAFYGNLSAYYGGMMNGVGQGDWDI